MQVIEGALVGGDFRVERLLGRGGMGAVYVALQLSTHRRRALKVMAPDLTRDARSVERFQEEARIRGRVHSPHVVETIAAGFDAQLGAPWLAMELLEGETLAARIERAGALPTPEAHRVLGQLASGLAAAHAVGLVHRDVKPENVFLADTSPGVPPTVKILDFGIAKDVGALASSPTASVGSPAWMAPEQANGEPIAPATDVWSFGLVAFFVLTGHVYWRAPRSPNGTVTQLLQEILLGELGPASSRTSGPLPTGFDAWFAGCLSRPPAARPRDAQTAWAGLEPLLRWSAGHAPTLAAAPRVPVTIGGSTTAGPQTFATPPSRVERRGAMWPWVVVGGAMVLVVGASGLVLALQGSAGSHGTPGPETAEEEAAPSKTKKKKKKPAEDAEDDPPGPAPAPVAPAPAEEGASEPDAKPGPKAGSGDATSAERAKFAAVCAKCAKNLPPGEARTFTVTVTAPRQYAVTPKHDKVVPCLVGQTELTIQPERDKVKTFQCVAVGPPVAPAPTPTPPPAAKPPGPAMP